MRRIKHKLLYGMLVMSTVFAILSVKARITQAEEASGEQTKAVRVAFYELEHFQAMDSNNQPSGYQIEYLERLSTYQNWELIYVPYQNRQQAVQALETGEVDVVGGMKYSEIEKSGVHGSEYMMGTTYITMLTSHKNEELIYEDYEGFNGISVGYVNNDMELQEFLTTLREHDTEVNVKPYADSSLLHAALKQGEVDAILTDFMEMNQSEERLLLRVSPLSLFFGISPDNIELLQQFNQAMGKLWNEDYDFTDTLMNEYYDYYNEIPFTKEELQYIINAPEFRVGYSVYRSPVAFSNSELSKVMGIERDIVNEIAAQCGLRFQSVAFHSDDTSQKWDKDKIDIVAGVAEGRAPTKEWDGTQTRSYLDCRKVVVCQRGYEFDTNKEFTLGLIDDTTTVEREVATTFPRAKLIYYNSLEACMEAVNKGEVSAALLNEYTVEKFIGKPRYDQLITVPNVSIREKLTLAILNDSADKEILVSILNKSIRMIDDKQIDAIIIQHTVADPYKITGEDFLDKYYLTVVVVICFVMSLLILSFRFSRKQGRVIHMLEQEQERYRLLLDNSDDIMFDVDIGSGDCITSSKFLQRFGRELPKKLSRKEGLYLYGLEDVLMVEASDQEVLHEMLKCLVQDESFVEQKLRILTRDQNPLWYRLQMQLMHEKEDNTRLLARLIDINQEMQENSKLRAISSSDALTGLMNKHSFIQHAGEQLEREPLETCAIVFMDIDNFKRVNDSFGHVEGDTFLQHVAREFREIFREEDYVSRFGGDEMCAMVRNVTRKEIEMMTSQILRTMCVSYVPPDSELPPVQVSVSIGIVMSPADGTVLDELMRKADYALYYAKHQGKNQAIFYVEEMKDNSENEDL